MIKITKFLIAGIVGLGTFFVPLKDAHFQNAQTTTTVVYAATGDQTTSLESKKELANFLDIILKIIYIFMWPFLMLAGSALDNGLVYGSYFQLDSALFTFWNIIKNFANFALGFLFLWSILKYIFNFGSKATNPMGMISKLLIAGIGIQASWFVMGALIDISTVATIGIGGLPLQLVKQEDIGKKPVFGVKTNLKISDAGNALTAEKGFVILYTYPTTPGEYYLPCAVKNQKLLRGDERGATFGVTTTGRNIGNSDANREQINKNYCMFGNNMLSFNVVKESDKILSGSPELKRMLTDSQTDFVKTNKCEDAGNICQTISTVVQKSKGYQGAFYTLYGSLLNLGSIHVSVDKSATSMTMESIIKAIIGISYLVPLMILCVILIIRIAVLWITIAFSPILVLSEVFEFKLSNIGKNYEKFAIKNALAMIFLPVIVTFAISISIVFLSVLSEGLTKGNGLEEIGMSTYNENNKTCINLVVTTLCLDNPTQDVGVSGMLDFFPRLILNIFGIGLMWTILMAAMKSTSFTGGVVDSIEKVAKNVVTTANIIPIGGGTSLAAIKNTGRKIGDSIERASETNARTVVAPGVENYFQRNFTDQVGKGKTQITSATTKISSNQDVNKQIGSLVGAGGALYNAPNSIISLEGNQLDLSQYGKEGLDLVNKTAEVGKLGPFNTVDEAFSNNDFIRYLATPVDAGGAGLSAEQIKSWYSGRDGLDNKITRNIDAIAAEAINTPTSGKLDKKTFIMPDGTTYSMTKDGFTSETKDKKTKQEFIDQKAWENLLSTIDKETMKKMKPDNATLSGDFQTWLDGNTTTNTGAQTPPANDNTQPNSSSSNNQP